MRFKTKIWECYFFAVSRQISWYLRYLLFWNHLRQIFLTYSSRASFPIISLLREKISRYVNLKAVDLTTSICVQCCTAYLLGNSMELVFFFSPFSFVHLMCSAECLEHSIDSWYSEVPDCSLCQFVQLRTIL